MITNDTQLLITKGYIEQYLRAKKLLQEAAPSLTEYPDNFVNRAQLKAVQTILDNLEHAVYEYENRDN